MRQTLTLYTNNPDDYIIQTISRDRLIDMSDGDYIVTSQLQGQLEDVWSGVDTIGKILKVANG